MELGVLKKAEQALKLFTYAIRVRGCAKGRLYSPLLVLVREEQPGGWFDHIRISWREVLFTPDLRPHLSANRPPYGMASSNVVHRRGGGIEKPKDIKSDLSFSTYFFSIVLLTLFILLYQKSSNLWLSWSWIFVYVSFIILKLNKANQYVMLELQLKSSLSGSLVIVTSLDVV